MDSLADFVALFPALPVKKRNIIYRFKSLTLYHANMEIFQVAASVH